MVQIVETPEQFSDIISSNALVIVDFHATWCGPCKMIAPKYEKFSQTYTNMTFIKVDVDEVPEVAQTNEIRAMPTFLIFKDGSMVEEIVGADPVKIETAIKKFAL
ncbi:hypothetical protein BC833DRAFT_576684 [Globomyces pollinis-pini]|nr:hypothetical protein BC833DRAFT_576684 [Globomyces pollinis-pini]KAJ2998511.1 Cytoplasmic thioredoxin isoenzyme 2 [Globomyces sp. JEL0801]